LREGKENVVADDHSRPVSAEPMGNAEPHGELPCTLRDERAQIVQAVEMHYGAVAGLASGKQTASRNVLRELFHLMRRARRQREKVSPLSALNVGVKEPSWRV